MTTTPLDIAALRVLLEKATKVDPLPWVWDGRQVIGPDHIYVPQGSSLGPTLIQLGDTYENHGAHCDLVAAAVNALPSLLDAVETHERFIQKVAYDGAGAAEARAHLAGGKE